MPLMWQRAQNGLRNLGKVSLKLKAKRIQCKKMIKYESSHIKNKVQRFSRKQLQKSEDEGRAPEELAKDEPPRGRNRNPLSRVECPQISTPTPFGHSPGAGPSPGEEKGLTVPPQVAPPKKQVIASITDAAVRLETTTRSWSFDTWSVLRQLWAPIQHFLHRSHRRH